MTRDQAIIEACAKVVLEHRFMGHEHNAIAGAIMVRECMAEAIRALDLSTLPRTATCVTPWPGPFSVEERKEIDALLDHVGEQIALGAATESAESDHRGSATPVSPAPTTEPPASFPCACSPRERDSGHRTECNYQEWMEYIDALRPAQLPVAQLDEHPTSTRDDAGSSPAGEASLERRLQAATSLAERTDAALVEAIAHQNRLRDICEERFQSMTEQYKRAEAAEQALKKARRTIDALDIALDAARKPRG